MKWILTLSATLGLIFGTVYESNDYIIITSIFITGAIIIGEIDKIKETLQNKK